MAAPTILWFRQDLRLADNHALAAAVAAGPVLPVYILDDDTPGEDRIGGAQRWWLHHSLAALAKDLAALGAPLVLRHGRSDVVLAELAREAGATTIHATRLYEPWWQRADAAIADTGCDLQLHDGNFLAPPDTLRTGSGGRYRIFSPYWRALQATMPPPAPIAAPQHIEGATAKSDTLEDWDLLPTTPDWATGFTVWTPGEASAHDALRRFVDHARRYDEARNLPSEVGTSQLSPHLHFGEISPAQVWHALADEGVEPFLRELAWRDFAANSIDQNPRLAREAGRRDPVVWRTGTAADADFTAWTHGRTGYPIVDAGMRQLWSIGWMHNRVRMIAASFLSKHLLIDWRRGERWFWDTLVDADFGSNAVNWQWVAGSGADASLFSRIMAPIVQSEKFGAGDYIRRWVPELAGLHDDVIHDPHGLGVAPADYPAPLIGHRAARERAMAAYRAAR